MVRVLRCKTASPNRDRRSRLLRWPMGRRFGRSSVPLQAIIEAVLIAVPRSIVNGLRDDDGESFYGDRASFYSEYSVKDNENVKLFFKEHERKNSKGSVNSFLSRKKPAQQQQPQSSRGGASAARPETKVCAHFASRLLSQST